MRINWNIFVGIGATAMLATSALGQDTQTQTSTNQEQQVADTQTSAAAQGQSEDPSLTTGTVNETADALKDTSTDGAPTGPGGDDDIATLDAQAKQAAEDARLASENLMRLEEEAREAQRRATAEARRAGANAERARVLRQEAEDAKQRAADAARDAAEKTIAKEKLDTELATANETIEALDSEKEQLSQRNWLILIGGGLAIGIGLIVAAYFLSRARKRSDELVGEIAERDAKDQQIANAADWLLIGEPGRLKLRGPLLAQKERGSVVGRGQAEADVIVDDKQETISRRHARFFYRAGKLFVEDMGSLNGTFVNDRRLNSGEVEQVGTGDQIKFANIAFNLQQA